MNDDQLAKAHSTVRKTLAHHGYDKVHTALVADLIAALNLSAPDSAAPSSLSAEQPYCIHCASYGHASSDCWAAPALTTPAQAPAIQAPEAVAWSTGITWGNRQSEMVVKLTKHAQPEHGFIHPLLATPSAAVSAGPVARGKPMPEEPTQSMIDAATKRFSWAMYLEASPSEKARMMYLAMREAAPEYNADAPEPITWRCFHCHASFTDRIEAQKHFGTIQEMPAKPACDSGLGRQLRAHQAAFDKGYEAGKLATPAPAPAQPQPGSKP